MARKIIIVGGVAGGASAATRLRRLDESAHIIMLERGPHVSFANCGLPYWLSGEIPEKSKLLVQSPERLKAVFNLDVRIHSEAIRVDSRSKTVQIRNTLTGETISETYDDLIISTGAAPIVPEVPGVRRAGHFVLRNIVDMERIDDWIRQKDARTAAVIGGGFIGLEVGEQLHRRGMKVTIIESSDHVLAPFDPEMAEFIHRELIEHGIELFLKNPVVGFEEAVGDPVSAASIVRLKQGQTVPADLVVMGLGVRPEIQLAADAGLRIGSKGGIWVDEHLRTSDPHIWAIGDVIEVRDGVTRDPARIALAGPANRQGRLVADNILGEPKAYRGTWGTAIIRVFRQTAACTGASEAKLLKANRSYSAIHLHPNSHAGYFPGAKSIALKVLFEPATGKLLGAQAVGEDGVDKRIDVLATALKAGLTVDDLADLELAYAPPYGSAKDPINLAGMMAQNVRSGKVKTIQWHELKNINESTYLVLDVRDQKERDQGRIPGSIHIPLAELRQRLGELPRDKEILAHCQSGQRSYNACRILMQNGFSCRNLTGSFRTWKAGTDAQQRSQS